MQQCFSLLLLTLIIGNLNAFLFTRAIQRYSALVYTKPKIKSADHTIQKLTETSKENDLQGKGKKALESAEAISKSAIDKIVALDKEVRIRINCSLLDSLNYSPMTNYLKYSLYSMTSLDQQRRLY